MAEKRARTGGNRSKAGAASVSVGYGRPPLHGQFTPGRSGNPRGRPKHSRNLKSILQQALTERVTVREGERRRSITRLEGVVLRQIEGALKGSDRAALATLKIAAQVGLFADTESAFDAPPLTAAEQRIMDDLLERANGPAKVKAGRRKKT